MVDLKFNDIVIIIKTILIRKAIDNLIPESAALSAWPLIWKLTSGNKEITGSTLRSICVFTAESSASISDASNLISFLPSI